MFRSLRFYRRTHAGVVGGTAIATAVLVGALMVEESARWTLQQAALNRLGDTEYALDVRRRWVDESLAEVLASALPGRFAPVLRLRGRAWIEGGRGRHPTAMAVTVLGVDEHFWKFTPQGGPVLGEHEVAVNVKVATRLGLRSGDELVLRVEKPLALSREAPLSSRKDAPWARLRMTVRYVIPDEALGRFDLAVNQVQAPNVFVRRDVLQRSVRWERRVNLILAERGPHRDFSSEDLRQAVRKVWRPEHVGVRVRAWREGHGVQVESEGIYLHPAVARAALSAPGAVGALTYLVDTLATEQEGASRMTPYGFVTACGGTWNSQLSPVPPDLREDEILLHPWTAERLGVTTGDLVRVTCQRLAGAGTWQETARVFQVRGVLRDDEARAERDRLPDFPGLTDTDDCADWDIGMPLNRSRLEDPDNEAYWDTWGPTPKAWIHLAAGESLWSNRFGTLMAVRVPGGEDPEQTIRQLVDRIDPADLGLFFQPVRELSLTAVREATSLGPLFMGMSAFLIVSGLLLTALLFTFTVEQRSAETGVLLAVGYRPSHLRILRLMEGSALAAAGAILGAGLGVGYTHALLWALNRFWVDVVREVGVCLHPTVRAVGGGCLLGFVSGLLTLTVVSGRQTRLSPRWLLTTPGDVRMSSRRHRGFQRCGLWGGIVLGGAALATAAVLRGGSSQAPGTFFAVGTVLLAAFGGLLFLALRAQAQPKDGHLTLVTLALRNAARRPGRSLAVAGLLACAVFLLVSVAFMQEDVGRGAALPSSGTGGFELYGESALPARPDLPEDWPALQGIKTVACRLYEGDDAGCFNLNRPRQPRLLGVQPDVMSQCNAFVRPEGANEVWLLLRRGQSGEEVPGLGADADTATWGLRVRKSDLASRRIEYTDEKGAPFRVQVVGHLPMRLSVMHGSVLISEEAFLARFPSEEGYRVFLFDVVDAEVGRAAAELTARGERIGLEVIRSVDRLAEFYGVERTYLQLFLVLGLLGLFLGVVGLVVVVLRNTWERRSELAALRALGFSGSRLHCLVLIEHLGCALIGIFGGLGCAVVAIWPWRYGAGGGPPALTWVVLGLGLPAWAAVWTAVGATAASRGRLVESLRNE